MDLTTAGIDLTNPVQAPEDRLKLMHGRSWNNLLRTGV
jgi:hypothetical protein